MKVAVIGAGGHSRSLCALLKRKSIDILSVWDENFSQDEEIIPEVYLKGKTSSCPDSEVKVIAVGDNTARASLLNSLTNVYESNLIDDNALIDRSASLGNYNQIYPFVFINAKVSIGLNNIINSGAIIEHETIIGNHCHISIGAKLGGRVSIGDYCFVGAGAIIIDKIKIGDNVTIGAGAVVVEDILESGTYVGVPARKIK